MKTPPLRLGHLLGTLTLGACLLTPVRLPAQDLDNRHAQPPPERERDATRETPDAQRPQRVLRELEALLKDGKFDEILQLAESVQATVKDNPRFKALIERAMGERKTQRHAAEPLAVGPGDAAMPPHARIQHLRLAAEQLNAAGYQKLAALARAEIARLDAEIKRQQAERQQVERQQVERQQAPSSRDAAGDANAAMKREMHQLRRELEELRSQLRNLKAEGSPKRTPQAPMPPTRPMPPNPPLESPR